MKVIDKGLKGVRRFNILDFAIFKTCIFAFGILTGIYFIDFFKNMKGALWGIFGVTYIHTMIKIFAPKKHPTIRKDIHRANCRISKKFKKMI